MIFGPRWTPEEVALLREHYTAIGALAMSRIIQRSPSACKHKAKLLGVQHPGWGWTRAEDQYIRDHYASDGPRAVALALGKSLSRTFKRAAKLGVRIRGIRAPNPNARVKALILAVAAEAGCTPSELLSANRKYVLHRWRIAKQCRDWGYSLPNIGRQLGRDHTTIRHGINRLGEVA